MAQRRFGSAPAGTPAPGRQDLHCWGFDAFRLDLRDERLWRGPDVLPLHPKTFAILRCLVTQAGQLVTKDMLLETVWPETVVSEAVIQVAIRELRRVLGDQARAPRFIATVHGRGYRFIAPVSALASFGRPALPRAPRPAPPPLFRRPPYFVGRDAELAQLLQWWTTAQQGTRQVGVIAGEPGIGKTALVQAFVAQVVAMADVWVGHGQCIEPYGVGEPYLPILEALGRLCRDASDAALVPLLRQHAPSWLVHLPALLPPEERERLAHTARGVTPTRMLRELAEALEVLTAERPLVLVLEDLHWSDRATLEWLAYVGRRRDPARLLILGTYRPVEVSVHAHPLRLLLAELQQHAQCVELVLDYLPAPAVAAYLTQRFAATALPAGLPQLFHQRTSGHPLFLVAMVDELARQQLLKTAGNAGGSQWAAVLSEVVPTGLRQYIEQRIEQLSATDQTLLEAASVAGSTFTVAAVAAGVAQAPETIEARYTALARHGQFIRASGTETWPDATVTACYQFRHTLYHEVVYTRVSAGHRVRLHQQIGARMEVGYGAQARQMAAELARHFTRGHDAWRAIRYLQPAGENALQRSAPQEAIAHLTKGLALVQGLPDTSDHALQELTLQRALGVSLLATKGFAAPEVEAAYRRARVLCQKVEDLAHIFPLLFGLWGYYHVRMEWQTARELAEELLARAQHQQDPGALLIGHYALGNTLSWVGEFVAARAHLEQGMALYDVDHHHTYGFHYGQDPLMGCRVYAARVLWILGYADQTLQLSEEAIMGAQQLAQPYSQAFAFMMSGSLHALRREWQAVQQQTATAIGLCTEHGFAHLMLQAMSTRNRALVMRGDKEAMAQVHQPLRAIEETGARTRAGSFALMAWSSLVMGQGEEALDAIDKGLVVSKATGERWYDAELYRLEGESLLALSGAKQTEAATCFQQALDIARHQQAKSWELRAAMSLSRLWQRQDKGEEAHALLAPLYGWFTEGFDTADLQEAKALLEDLA